MVDQKTDGLFRMLTRLMIAERPGTSGALDKTLYILGHLIGVFFQICDDYQNLASADYAKQKGYMEDLDEGKYSFTLIHCIQTLETDPTFAGGLILLRALLMKRRVEGKLTNESKREVLGNMGQTEQPGIHPLGPTRTTRKD